MGGIFGKGSNTTTSTQTANPTAAGYYGQAFNLASQVAGTPTSAVPLAGVANLSAGQQAGIGQTNQYSQYGIPYINQALQLQTQAANPLTSQQIQNYYNPYQQNVINATEAQFNNQNAQQQQQVLGNAAAQGALGGDRVGVAQANLAAQQQIAQAPVIAGLEQQGYNQALQTAQQQYQLNPQQAAFGIANSGVAAQNAGLQGAAAQFGAGNVQQQYGPYGQAALNALYQQQLGQFQLPFQESQLLTQAAGGLGPLYGGTSSTTTPPPSALSQIIGAGALGLGALGMTGGFGSTGYLNPNYSGSVFHAKGGRVRGYDDGGFIPYAGQSDMIHVAPMHFSNGLPAAPKGTDTSAQSKQWMQIGLDLAKQGKDVTNNFGKGQPLSLSPGGFPSTSSPVGTMAPIGQNPELGDGLGALHSTGGFVSARDPNGIYVPQGYADGGAPDWLNASAPPTSAAWPSTVGSDGTVYTDYSTFDQLPGQDVKPAATRAWAQSVDRDMTGSPAFPSAASYVPVPAYHDEPPAPVAPTTTAGIGTGTGTGAGGDQTPPAKDTFGASSPLWQGVLGAGFGMLASKSPFPGVAIGEGGLQGLQAYEAQQKQQIDVDKEAKRLAQQADQFQKSLAQQKELHATPTAYQQYEMTKPFPIGQSVDFWGRPVTTYGTRDANGNIVPAMPRHAQDTGAQGQTGVVPPQTGAPGTPAVPPLFAPGGGYKILDVKATPAAPDGTPLLTVNHLTQAEAQTDQALRSGDTTQFPAGTNPEVLRQHPEVANIIKMIAEGRFQFPPRALQGNQAEGWNKILNWTAEYDPSFDASNFSARQNLRKQYLGGGKLAQGNQSFNMALQHVGEYMGAVEDLSKYNSTYFPHELNSAKSAIYSRTDPKYQEIRGKLDTAAHAVSDELMRAFRGTGSASEREAADWQKKLDPLGSPVSLRSVGQEAVKLLSGRIEANGDTWNQGMGPTSQREPESWLSPKARSVYDAVRNMDPQKGLQPRAAAPSAPAPAPMPPVPGARLAPDGNWYVPDPNRQGKYLQVH